MTHFRLASAATPTKLIMTFFLCFMLLSFAAAALMTHRKTGLGLEGVKLRYEGAPDDESTDEIHFPITYEELLRLTHVHTFGMGILFFLLGHVFILTSKRVATKVAVISTFFTALILFTASPWLVRYVWAGFGYLFLLSHLALGLVAIVTVAIPIHEMWFRRDDGHSPRPHPP